MSSLAVPLPLTPLRNEYFVLRHGHSVPNERGIIVSSLLNGKNGAFGLSGKGRAQATAAGKSLAVHLAAHKQRPVLVLTSPFTRAEETAKLVAGELTGAGFATTIRVVTDLRERFFGFKEMLPDTEYAAIWECDAKDANHRTFNSESPVLVWGRVRETILHCERALNVPSTVLLVSHGDTLQITETALRGMALTKHRTIEHLHQAEWRDLTLLHAQRLEREKAFTSKL